MIKKAFILAAGMGTRLEDLTADKPKALVKVNGKPMIQRVIEELKEYGISEFMINIHHHGQQLIEFLDSKNNFNVAIQISDEQEELLDTGGAIAKAGSFFAGNDPVLVHNVDVISAINLKALFDYHIKTNAIATLCVRKRNSSRALLFDDDMLLTGWTNYKTKQFKWVDKPQTDFESFAFSGIFLVEPVFVQHLPMTGRFSIIDAWLKMAGNNKIAGYHDTSHSWFDLGTKEKIAEAEKHLKSNHIG